MRYKLWVILATVVNIGIIVTIAYSIFTITTVILSLQGAAINPDYSGQPWTFMAGIVLSLVNTAFTAFAFISDPTKNKFTALSIIVIPFIILAIACTVAMFQGLAPIL